MAELAKLALFVTGTDTGVGKTLVSAALLHTLARHYPRVAGMKPVAVGLAAAQDDHADVLALRQASNCHVPPELDSPVLLADAVSPHIAAARAGCRIDLDHIVRCYRALAGQVDALVVEGAGGFMVPLSPSETGADLALSLDLPVVLVVGLRLGCLNHTLLSAEAIRHKGLRLAGWVANQIDPDMLALPENISFLQQALGAPLLASIAFQAQPDARSVRIELPAAWLASHPCPPPG